jgi:C4-type Zn-finger protein
MTAAPPAVVPEGGDGMSDTNICPECGAHYDEYRRWLSLIPYNGEILITVAVCRDCKWISVTDWKREEEVE